MLYFLHLLQETYGPLRLFEYLTFRATAAALTAMTLGFILGPVAVKILKKFNTMAPTRLEGLIEEELIDRNKDKTPSMGGILIVGIVILTSMLWANLLNPYIQVLLFVISSLAILGFVDDFVKVKYQKRDGISGKVKLIAQIAIAGSAIYYLHFITGDGDVIKKVLVPFYKEPLQLFGYSAIVALFLGILTIIGSSNAVNLTDGKDGLAIGGIIFSCLAYGVITYLTGHIVFAEYLHLPHIPMIGEVVVFIAALIGASVGFLWYNCYPASMFMGDTGSLSLGGSIGLIAVLVRQELTLIIIGGLFVMEALSVIIQVLSFKYRNGKRIFLCAPIHHHFEKKGWTETQIIVRFWILAGIFALIGLATLKLR